MITKNEKTEVINYSELARRVGDCVMMNNITIADENLYDNLENGELYYETEDEEETEAKEIYQFYAITSGGADYLKRNTDEIVFYSDLLDTYFWAITHFGTPWSGVDVTVKDY
jgi:hypothetical protein